MSNYKLSAKAKEDLENIWNYTIEVWSRNQANKYLKLIFAECDRIVENPNLGRNYSQIRKDYFGRKIGSHIIFFKISNSKEIEVVRILHEKMDLKSRIKG